MPPPTGSAAPAICGSGASKNDPAGHPIYTKHTESEDGEQAKQTLLACLRIHCLRLRLYLSEVDSIGVALDKGLIDSADAVALLHDLDGCECLGAQAQ